MRRSVWTLVMVMTVVLTLTASPALAAQPNFGVDASKVCLGNAYGHASYGGDHIASVEYEAYGNLWHEVYAAFVDQNSYGEPEVRVAQSYNGGLLWEDTYIYGRGVIDEVTVAVAATPSKTHAIWAQYDETLARSVLMYNKRNGPQNAVNISGPSFDLKYSIGTSIAGTSTGELHIAFAVYGGDVYYINSPDNGLNFSQPMLVGSAGSNSSELSIRVDETTDTVFLAWEGSGEIFLSKKLAGQAWSSPVKVSGTYSARVPRIAVLDDQNIYVAFGASGITVVASTSNGGATEADWSHSVVGDSSFRDPSLAVDTSSGNSYGDLSVVGEHYDSVNRTYDIHIYRSTNGGSSWVGPYTVMTDARFPNIVLDSEGKAHVMSANGSEYAVYYTKEK